MDWYGTKPDAPCALSVNSVTAGVELCWESVKGKDGEPAVRYNVYGAAGDSIDVSNPENLLAGMLDATSFVWYRSKSETLSFAVTAVDAYGVESEPVTAMLKRSTNKK